MEARRATVRPVDVNAFNKKLVKYLNHDGRAVKAPALVVDNNVTSGWWFRDQRLDQLGVYDAYRVVLIKKRFLRKSLFIMVVLTRNGQDIRHVQAVGVAPDNLIENNDKFTIKYKELLKFA